MKAIFSAIDEKIQEVASEGNGSRRRLDFDFTLGRMGVDAGKNMVFWEMRSKYIVILPRTAEYFGNMIVGSNLETEARESIYNGTDAYVLENKHLRVYIRKIGSRENPENYNTSDILLGVYQKDLNQWLPLKSLEITIDNTQESLSGSGYTEIERLGEDLPYGQVTAYMQSGYINYTLRFRLESGTDFLIIEGSV
ncbi:MAG TPA: hypothetical protein ENG00_00925 [Candidatus Aenigmarchaeota archaeon]|nr:hypothetical protein [Candidatus Aenigmarchaeota archaeon]